MKKLVLIVVTGAILISCVLISSIMGGSAEKNAAAEPSAQSETKAESRYVLSSQNGRLVVFKDGGDKPFLVTDTFVNSLPKSDRIRLENGVEVEGERELQKAIEDYCS